jgi:hypothetical protein
LLLISLALYYLSSTGGYELVMLIVSRVARTATALSLALLGAKFGFPKLDVQTQLLEGNVAVGLLMGAIIIGANL